jgi:hypothetical protein
MAPSPTALVALAAGARSSRGHGEATGDAFVWLLALGVPFNGFIGCANRIR